MPATAPPIVKSDGTLWAWGENDHGQVGDGAVGGVRPTPEQIGTATNWTTIAAGNDHTLATKTDGTLWSWGNNSGGELSAMVWSGRDQPTPTQVGSGTGWKHAATGYNHTVALKADGSLWAWGANDQGQLGVRATTTSLVPEQVGGTTRLGGRRRREQLHDRAHGRNRRRPVEPVDHRDDPAATSPGRNECAGGLVGERSVGDRSLRHSPAHDSDADTAAGRVDHLDLADDRSVRSVSRNLRPDLLLQRFTAQDTLRTFRAGPRTHRDATPQRSAVVHVELVANGTPGHLAGFGYLSAAHGAMITRTGISATRLYLVATKCASCGTLTARWNGVTIGSVSLHNATTIRRQVTG